MSDTETSPVTLLDGLAGLDPEARRELATNLRQVSATFDEVPDGKTTSHGSASWLTCSTRPDQLVDLYRIWLAGSWLMVTKKIAELDRRTWKGSRGTNRHTLSGMFTSAARCRRSAIYRMKRNSPSASLWSAFPGSTGKTKRSSSTAEQRPETGGRQPL